MHHGKKLDKSDAEKNINNIFYVHRYLIENASTFIGDVLGLAEKTRFQTDSSHFSQCSDRTCCLAELLCIVIVISKD